MSDNAVLKEFEDEKGLTKKEIHQRRSLVSVPARDEHSPLFQRDCKATRGIYAV